MAKSTTSTSSSSTSNTKEQSQSQSQSTSTSQSTTQAILNKELLDQILAGLQGGMTDEEITSFAEALLRPQLNAGIEAAQQEYESTKLAKEQEIENLASSLAKSVEQQQSAYRHSIADVETAALSRGMGRSSYTLQSLANQGDALAKAVQQLTDENARQSQQIQQQITQAQQQYAQTSGRLNTDYASQLAAKVQELKEQQRREQNQNYMTAVSGSLGQQTTGTQTGSSLTNTTGSSTTNQSSQSTSTTSSGGGGRSKKKTTTDIVDAVSY